jgi:hypothetical protein
MSIKCKLRIIFNHANIILHLANIIPDLINIIPNLANIIPCLANIILDYNSHILLTSASRLWQNVSILVTTEELKP